MKSTILLYEDKPKYDLWLKCLMVGIPSVTLIIGLVVISLDLSIALTLFGITVFYILLFWAILPQSYQIYQDRIRIKLGAPFAFNIPLASIQEAKKTNEYYAYGYWGIRFATSNSNVLEIKRNKGISVVISPSDAAAFLERLGEAQKSLADGN